MSEETSADPGAGPRGGPLLPCDVLVVGGGIHGVCVARDLAGRGLRVVLTEQHDLASHASSASTKLLAGGLPAPQAAPLAGLREVFQERERLLRSAPHLCWPLRFVLPAPTGAGTSWPAWKLRLALLVHDHLARRETLPAARSIDLRAEGVGAPLHDAHRRGFLYSDGWVDDARLTLLNALQARERGATVFTRTRCVQARRSAQAWHATLRHRDGTVTRVEARALVNACGAWSAAFLRDVLQPLAGSMPAVVAPRLVRGSHIVVPRLFEHDHAYALPGADRRLLYVLPYEQRFTLIGTTERVADADPTRLGVETEEIQALCDQVNRHFKHPVAPVDVVWAFSGVRALPPEDERSDALMRSDASAAPLLTLWGGSLAGARRHAQAAADRLSRLLGETPRPWTEGAALPGGDLSDWVGAPTRPEVDFQRFVVTVRQRYPWLLDVVARRLARTYGSRIDRVLGDAQSLTDLGAQIAPGLFEAELRYLRREEWATLADDVLWRRSKLGLHFTPEQSARVVDWMNEPGGTPRAQPKLRVA